MREPKLTSAEKCVVIVAIFGAFVALGMIVWAVLAIVAESAP